MKLINKRNKLTQEHHPVGTNRKTIKKSLIPLMKKKDIIMISIAIAFLLGAFIYGKWRDNYLESAYEYKLAKVVSVTGGKAHGFDVCYEYIVNGKIFEFCINTLNIPREGEYILIRISTKDPEVNKWDHIEVPPCLLENPDLNKEWETIPECK